MIGQLSGHRIDCSPTSRTFPPLSPVASKDWLTIYQIACQKSPVLPFCTEISGVEMCSSTGTTRCAKQSMSIITNILKLDQWPHWSSLLLWTLGGRLCHVGPVQPALIRSLRRLWPPGGGIWKETVHLSALARAGPLETVRFWISLDGRGIVDEGWRLTVDNWWYSLIEFFFMPINLFFPF